jgi:hypothetical protein
MAAQQTYRLFEVALKERRVLPLPWTAWCSPVPTWRG